MLFYKQRRTYSLAFLRPRRKRVHDKAQSVHARQKPRAVAAREQSEQRESKYDERTRAEEDRGGDMSSAALLGCRYRVVLTKVSMLLSWVVPWTD